MTPTMCEDCDNVTAATRKLYESQWTCIRHPRLPSGFVKADADQPYMRCVGINGGKCPLWVRRRDGQLESGL